MISDFSFIILTYNEETHIQRLLESIKNLNSPNKILDSGSTDKTLSIAEDYKAEIYINTFESHPKQWDYALKNLKIDTPWIICLDADQYLSETLFSKLKNFDSNKIDKNINGIYFNRKNYFKGRWIKHGGYFPKYMLKMFRTGKGFSDLNEKMDHRFIVEGKTILWHDGYLIEENLKENQLSFWIDKHNRYSDLLAAEEVERRRNNLWQTVKPNIFGTPDEKIAFYKKTWWSLPLLIRPFLYFFYRYFLRLGFLDGREGFIFHFLQAFWFRFIIDVKIIEKRKL
jgi:glycosyltransferase involved in cell wall biosynthesis